MGTTNSPNMNLPIPVVGNQPGPTYAQNVDTCLTLIDQHDHTTGNGVPITPAAIDMTADLTFKGFAATNLRALTMVTQSAVTDTQAMYVIGVDLYYRDGNNNEIRLTESGSIIGTPGSITGLPSGTAGVAFSGGIYTFSASTNVPANLQIGSVALGNNSALSHYLTLAPPFAMSSDYTVTLPTIPANTSILQIDTSGNMITGNPTDSATLQYIAGVLSIKNLGVNTAQLAAASVTNAKMAANAVGTSNIIDANVTRAKQAAVGQQISSSSGSFTTASGSPVDITNLTVTITTTGRPVILAVQGGTLTLSRSTNTNLASGSVYLVRGVTTLATQSIAVGAGSISETYQGDWPGSIFYVDAVGAGTYTYKVQAATTSAQTTIGVSSCVLVAYEL